jgi:hypothetical protein
VAYADTFTDAGARPLSSLSSFTCAGDPDDEIRIIDLELRMLSLERAAIGPVGPHAGGRLDVYGYPATGDFTLLKTFNTLLISLSFLLATVLMIAGSIERRSWGHADHTRKDVLLCVLLKKYGSSPVRVST